MGANGNSLTISTRAEKIDIFMRDMEVKNRNIPSQILNSAKIPMLLLFSIV